MKKLIRLLTARPLTAITCLLVALIVLANSTKIVVPTFRSGDMFPDLKVGTTICQGWIDSTPVINEDGRTKLTVQLQGCKDGSEFRPQSGRIQLTVKEPPSPLGGEGRGEGAIFPYASLIRFKTSLHEPTDFKNPGGFKYKRYLLSRGISAIGFVGDPRWVIKIGEVDGHYLRKTIESWRQKIATALLSISDPDIRAVSRALLIGDGGEINDSIKEDFRRSGLAHILVISGLNVAFVALAVFFTIKWLLLLVPNLAVRINVFKPAAALTIIAVWLYAYLTGAEVSVVRAAIMATVYLAGIVLDKRQDVFTSLSLAALIIIAGSPLAVFDISFQLSFVAVISLAVIYPWIIGHFKWMSPRPNEGLWARVRRYLGETVAASVAATVGVAPLIAYYFHYSSMAGILANIIVVPWAGFILTPISLIVSFLAIVSASIAALPLQLFGWLIEPMLFIAHKASAISTPITIALTPPKMFIALFYILLFGVAGFRGSSLQAARGGFIWRNLKVANPLLIVLLMFLSLGFQRGWFSKPALEVTFLDVGQGASTFIRFPDGRVMVVDGGGFMNSDFDLGKFAIAPYLWQKGISKIDWLVLTHPHPDHFKGLAFLAEEFSPKMLLWNGVSPSPHGGEGWGEGAGEDTSDWDEFVARINKANEPMNVVIPVEVSGNLVNAGDPSFHGDDFHVQFLSPPAHIPADWNLNNTSLVMLITYGDKNVLLTGDIEAEAEEYLTKSLATSHQPLVTVFQVPHHGSSTSSTKEFLGIIRPENVVIQVGENNRYRFPNADVLERLEEIGANIFRTDKEGAIEWRL